MKTLPEVKATFRYDGKMRHLENVTVEEKTGTIVGMEKRKAGKFSNKIKRFTISKMEGEINIYA